MGVSSRTVRSSRFMISATVSAMTPTMARRAPMGGGQAMIQRPVGTGCVAGFPSTTSPRGMAAPSRCEEPSEGRQARQSSAERTPARPGARSLLTSRQFLRMEASPGRRVTPWDLPLGSQVFAPANRASSVRYPHRARSRTLCAERRPPASHRAGSTVGTAAA
jgi:hypothetical protein